MFFIYNFIEIFVKIETLDTKMYTLTILVDKI